MKKSLIAIFSVSVTLGTSYLVYTQVKNRMIDKLVKSWMDEAKKRNKELDENYLKDELNKLHAWDVKLMADYYNKFIHGASNKALIEHYKKIVERKIPERVDLMSVERVVGGS